MTPASFGAGPSALRLLVQIQWFDIHKPATVAARVSHSPRNTKPMGTNPGMGRYIVGMQMTI